MKERMRKLRPNWNDSFGIGQLVLLCQRVVAEVDRLGILQRLVRAPRPAPEPLLRQREDGHCALGNVGQVLVEVGKRVLVRGVLLVAEAQMVAGPRRTEALEIDCKEGRDVIRLAIQLCLPVR